MGKHSQCLLRLMATDSATLLWRPRVICRRPEDEFFSDGDKVCGRRPNKRLVTKEREEQWKSSQCFECQSTGCKETFSTVAEYELHYNSAHRHPCMDCHRAFPTNHLLDIHISESHDPLFDIQSQTQDMFRCLLETCLERFRTHLMRRDHMIRRHKYPANFRFEKSSKEKRTTSANTGNDVMETDRPPPVTSGPISLAALARHHLQTKKTAGGRESWRQDRQTDRQTFAMQMGAQNVQHTEEMEVETAQTSRRFVYSKRVPGSICFGAGSQRGFMSASRGRKARGRHWHQVAQSGSRDTVVSIEDMDMGDMAQALDS